MSVSVSMPQLGESVTEGTVTRWLKREGEHVQADEPLLEVSTDKVDTEIPSPVSGVLRGITVAEDETVAVGAELAIIDEDGAASGQAEVAPSQLAASQVAAQQVAAPQAAVVSQVQEAQPQEAAQGAPAEVWPGESQPAPAAPPAYEQPAASYEPPAASYEPPAASYEPPAASSPHAPGASAPAEQAAYSATAASYAPEADYDGGNGQAPAAAQFADAADGPYVTPLVRKLAAEHGIDLAAVAGTGVGGRIRKQDILDAAALQRGPVGAAPVGAAPVGTAPVQPAVTQQPAAVQPAAAAQQPAAAYQAAAPATAPQAAPAVPATRPVAPAPVAAPSATESDQETGRPRPVIVPSSLRGTTERMSRARQVIAQRMVESLQTSAQLTTVVEADVTAIARLRDRAKAAFEAREGVKLSFLPFFALAAVEALKVHPKLNAVIDTASGQVTYHDAEHLGIAVDTERGLMVPVIKNSGDLNIGGLARKIADLAQRTRAGHVSPDDLSGGTFTLTNTGSRGALFDTPIINQPQVGILGTGTVVKRAVVVEDQTLGEVITVRSMVYLALTYDHRLVDGADAARFLVTIKDRLEEGAFETELGL
jgi:pyruvate dehydrogenase E2 component (dihydrolipoamide acetyltransferase)